MATVRLLVAGDRNRELLADALADDHEVRAGAADDAALADAEFDLCLVDDRSFRARREALADRKAAAEPVFLPYLLLLGDAEAAGVPGDVWATVDEVIETPVDPAALAARVDNLLQRRELSLELDRRRATSERRFERLFESIPDPTAVITDGGVVTAANDAFARTFGVDPDAAVGTHVSELPTVGDGTRRVLLGENAEDGAGGTGSDEPRTAEVEAADGERRAVELNVAAVDGRDGRDERIVVFRDVTAREANREELRRRVEQLERFASVVSHDLRDPLNTAQAKVRLARRECDSGYLADLSDVHDRMAELIEDVLTLAKQGRAIGETRPVALADAAEAAWSTVDDREGATLRIDDDPGRVAADPERLRALLENLFRNAVRHAGPEVTVRVGRLPDRPGFVVEDDGPGIPPEEREAVFEYGRTTAEDGSGLGLAIVAEVATAHGWTVEATEGTAGGARFEFTTAGE